MRVVGGVGSEVSFERFPHLENVAEVNAVVEEEGYGVILVHAGLSLGPSEGTPSALKALSTFPNSFPALRVGHMDSTLGSGEVRKAALALFERCSGVAPPEDLFEVAMASGGHGEKVIISYNGICVMWTGEASNPVAILTLGKHLENALTRDAKWRWEWAQVEVWGAPGDARGVFDSEWWKRRRPHLVVHARDPNVLAGLESVAGLIGSDVAIGVGTRRGLVRRIVADARKEEGIDLSGLETRAGHARLVLPDKRVVPVPQNLLGDPQRLALWIRAQPVGSLQEMRSTNIRAVWRIFEGPVLIGWADSESSLENVELAWDVLRGLAGSLAETKIPLILVDSLVNPYLLDRVGGAPYPHGLPAIGFFSRSLGLKSWFRGKFDIKEIHDWVADALAGKGTFDPESALAPPVNERFSHPVTGDLLSLHLHVLVGHTLEPLALRNPPAVILFYDSEAQEERRVENMVENDDDDDDDDRFDLLSLWSNLAQVCYERDIPVTIAVLDVAENAVVPDMIWGAEVEEVPSAIFFSAGARHDFSVCPHSLQGQLPSFEDVFAWVAHSVLGSAVSHHDL